MAANASEVLRKAFPDLEAPHISALAKVAVLKKCKPRDVIIRQHEPGDTLFGIASGYFNVSVIGPDGAVCALGVMGQHEIFGELSLIDGAPRSATVIASSRGELVCIRREPFMDQLKRTPTLAVAVMRLLARRIRRLTEHCDNLVGRPVSQRLAKQVVLLAESHGMRTSTDCIRIGIKLSQQELGQLVGASRESVNQHLRLWIGEKVLAREAGYLVIANEPLLRSIAGA